MNTYVPIFRGLDAHGGRKLRTHTHTRDMYNYSNSRCALARRGLTRVYYSSLITDLEAMGLLVEYDTEIGSLGHFTSATIEAIIIESVGSISRDERDVPLTQYITNA